MALFGAPVAREGDPERAVRAALSIRDWVRREHELQVRIAVNTGEALVTIAADSSAGETMAAGDVLNTASRLQTAAPDNGVIVGEQTYWATRSVIAYREAEPVVAKGKSRPVPVWEAVGARDDLRGARLHRTPFVGRSRELESLESAFADVRSSASARRATLLAGPGQGKSRLVHEFRAGAAEAGWLEGRCVPYGTGVTSGPSARSSRRTRGFSSGAGDDGDREARDGRARSAS